MSTRAAVIDGRCEKGFWVRSDGYPAGLGLELKNIFSSGKSIEQVYQELVNKRVEEYNRMAQKFGAPPMNVENNFFVLSPEQVKVARQMGANGLWGYCRIDAAYIYTLMKDGVYVKGLEIPKQRKVKEQETIRS